jgi:hypothetical protein
LFIKTSAQTAPNILGKRKLETEELSELHNRIVLRAYQLYEKRGRVHGHALDDWLRAEQEILSERMDTDFG